MRRFFMLMITFSLFVTGCSPPFTKTTDSLAKREDTAFSEWDVPSYFIPKRLQVVGLGDSLTQGVGDEQKKGGYFGRVSDEMIEWKGVVDVDAKNLAKRGRRSDQLLDQLEDSSIQSAVKKADVILLTIGGNDVMKVVKKDIFNMKKEAFYIELGKFENRLDEVFSTIRALNGDAIIVVAGLYNPFSIVSDEVNEFEDIITDWNEAIEVRSVLDGKSCFVPVADLFDSNANMVYHTDFFHPNAKGYDSMADRFLERIGECDLLKLSDGKLDM